MSENKDMIPIGTLYADPARECVYLLTNYQYSKNNPEKEKGYYFVRVSENNTYSKSWSPQIGSEKELRGVLYCPKRNRC